MISERGPRPGTMTARIYEGFMSGRPRVEMFTELELTGKPNKKRRASLLDHISSNYIKDRQLERFAAWRAADKPNRSKESYRTDEFRFNLSRGKGGTLIKCWPLFLRKLPTESIMQITGFRRFQVASCLEECRRKDFLKRPTEEERREIYRLAKPGDVVRENGNKKSGKRIYSPEESNAFAFARNLQEASLITNDLTNWQELRKLYGQHGRELPQSFAVRLRLEVFYSGVKMWLTGEGEEKGKILSTYAKLGTEVNGEWFKNSLGQEQKFIKDYLEREWVLEQSVAMRNSNGHKNGWRELFPGVEEVIVDGDQFARLRTANRERQKPGRP